MKRFGEALIGVGEPHRRESHVGKVSTIGEGGRSISITNMNNSQLRNTVPIMPYGISSSPKPGLMAYVLVAQDCSKDGIVGVYDPNKPICSPGECIMYSAEGAMVKCSGKNVTINKRNILKEIDDLNEEIENLKDKIRDLESKI